MRRLITSVIKPSSTQYYCNVFREIERRRDDAHGEEKEEE